MLRVRGNPRRCERIVNDWAILVKVGMEKLVPHKM
jgi:hypothetical protein